MDSSRLEQLYELRLLLEPHAAARAALTMSEDARTALSKLAAEMEVSGDEPVAEAYGRFAQLDGQFHDLIAHAGGNELIQETLASLHTHVHLFRLFYHARVTSDAISEHRSIITALQQRDAEAARQSMRTHIERSRDRFMKAFTP